MAKKKLQKFIAQYSDDSKDLNPSTQQVLKSLMIFMVIILLLFFDFFIVTIDEVSSFKIISSFQQLS